MRAKDIPAIREKLTKACDEAIAKGWEIRAGSTLQYEYRDGKGVTCCCPIGAATGSRLLSDAVEVIGISYEGLNRFAAAFDGYDRSNSHMAKLGREFREKYLGGKQ